MKTIPVILHTDLGTDIDDSWALLMMLRQKWLKPLMVLADTDDVVYRAAIAARMLDCAGRHEVEIGLGCGSAERRDMMFLKRWMQGYDLSAYRGKVYEDGVGRAVELIRASRVPVTLISIAPCQATARMLEQAPDIAGKVDFVGVFGSVYVDYERRRRRCAEYNVRRDVKASKLVLEAPWRSVRLTPLDSCGVVQLDAALFSELEASPDKDVRLLMDSVRSWNVSFPGRYVGVSSILFDTVAVHMASSLAYLEMKEIPILVDKRGRTCPNRRYGHPMQVAVGWRDLPGYHRFLVDTLLGRAGKP